MSGAEAREPPEYELTLFVSGASDLAARSIENATRACDLHLAGRYRLAVVDVHEDPAAVLGSQVVAVPTLVRQRPLPVRRIAGELSDTARVCRALDLPAAVAAIEPG
jgi:circadian clock protein KaiB